MQIISYNCMKCQSLFSGKVRKKNIDKFSAGEIAQRVVKVNLGK